MLTFYHAPRSCSSGIHWLLEELGVSYKTEIVEIRREGGAPESYRAIPPHKKVPAIVHDGVVITERTLTANPYVLGNRFTAADIPVAGALFWGLNVLGQVPSRPVFLNNLARIEERPAFMRTFVQAPSAEMAA